MFKFRFILTVVLLSNIIYIVSCKQKNSGNSEIKLLNNNDTISYILGTISQKNFRDIDFTPNSSIFMRGLSASPEDSSLFTEEQINLILQQFQQNIMKTKAEKAEKAATKNKQEGDTFLTTNKAKEGVVTTESGLQYKIITAGTGITPQATDKVKCNYTGKLIDGTIFDQSASPVEFPVNGVIKGWQEALQLMPQGSKWELYIPSELGYGAQGAGQKIGPNAVLTFEIELLEIVKE